jgi:hypothetical protein
VVDHGVGRFLDAVAEARRRVPDVLILPGVEAAPSYYWQGSPWSGLSLRDFDRHLWIVGLEERELERLPVIGNETWSNTELRWSRVWPPAIALVVGLAVLIASVRGRRVLRWPAVALLAFALALAWNHYPFGDVARPHRGRHDPGPFQRLIDYVDAHGGVVYWSYPEATCPAVQVGAATMAGEPHPEDLLETDGYDGFEGLYGDEITVTEPGREWDRVLLAFLRGERRKPAFVVTGIDYHGTDLGDAWSALDGGRTVLLLDERTVDAVRAALRGGHGYATFMGLPQKFRLDAFEVTVPGGATGSHGDMIRGDGPVRVRIVMAWEGSPPPDPPPFELRLILDGRVVSRRVEHLPVEIVEEHDPAPGKHYFRLLASAGRLNRVVSNPVFVEVDPSPPARRGHAAEPER